VTPAARRGIGRAALLIGAITVLARAVGYGRTLVFAHTVRAYCLGTAYQTANQVPNIIYDIVAGGALTAVVVPLLAGPVSRAGDDPAADQDSRRVSSALLTWTVVLLVPVSALAAVAARPVTTALLGSPRGCPQAEIVSVSARMLAIFAPQIALYGLAVVLYGILQSHHRFTAPALAPLVSSVVVGAAYLAFLPLARGAQYDGHLHQLSRPAELMLAGGTTAGVLALVVTAAVPVLSMRLRLRPTLRFPAGVSARARALAVAGVATLAAQDAAVIAVIKLANSRGGGGALVLYNYGWQMFFLPYAVLAVPVAISAFPLLAAQAPGTAAQAPGTAAQAPGTAAQAPGTAAQAPGTAAQESPGAAESAGGFAATAAAAARAATLVGFLGAAVLAGAAAPAARVFVSANQEQARQLMFALVAFAPGLAGYGLAASLQRILFASGRNRSAAAAVAGGWLLVIVADVAIVPFVHRNWTVPALGIGNTIGLTVSGIMLTVVVRRACGAECLRGLRRAVLGGLAGAIAGAAAGAGVAAGAGTALPAAGFLPQAGLTLLACVTAVAVFSAVAYLADPGDLRKVALQALRAVRAPRAPRRTGG
jgi:putative peptidoglycan lipid II flippase